MRIGRSEQVVHTQQEPLPLGVGVDPESAALYEEFAPGRSLDTMYYLWKDPEVTNLTVRQRIVTVLTAPQVEDLSCSLPYSQPNQSLARLLHIEEEVDGERTSLLSKRLAGKPELAKELAAGLLYWADNLGPNMQDARMGYRNDFQTAIQNLIPIVDEATADKLFTLTPVNDLGPYGNNETAPGYRGLTNLLFDPEIPRKYKEIGLDKWMKAADQEEQAKSLPYEKHERAIKRMAEFVQSWSYSTAVDDELYTKLVDYLETNTPVDTPYIKGLFVGRVAEHITDDNVRFNFAWRHIIVDPDNNFDRFRINNEHDLALVEWTQEQAHNRNCYLFDAQADILVQEYQVKLQEQAAELDLQARLRT